MRHECEPAVCGQARFRFIIGLLRTGEAGNTSQMAEAKLRVWNRTRDVLVASAADVANTSQKRRDGLLKRTGLGPGEGLWIAPCEAVHCFFMKFTIDVVFLTKDKRVVKVRPSLKPWRLAACLRAHSVLELAEGAIEASGTRVGDQLEFEKLEES